MPQYQELDPKNNKSYGWKGSVQDFLLASDSQLLDTLRARAVESMFPASTSQIAAWENCITLLRSACAHVLQTHPDFGAWSAVFEYELPRERGRRPDVVLLGSNKVVVLEFKDFEQAVPAHADQVAAYARDLRHYHSESQDKEVSAALVRTRARGSASQSGEVVLATGDSLAEYLAAAAASDVAGPIIDSNKWVEAAYAPLPTLVEAARRLFQHEPLPNIRRATSAGIPSTLAYLDEVACTARERGELHLALIAGVPGAGKTLVGLQFVYQRHFDGDERSKNAVFLSGNGPLVKVLQHALHNSIFVQDVHGFLRQYGGEATQLPNESIWVYDEAQRAWDADRVSSKRGHSKSEPEDFLSIGVRKGGWALMIGLVGEGQEIHLGEEAGLGQWNAAIKATGGQWIVHCPPRLAPTFPAAKKVEAAPVLDLTHSMRSHVAEGVQLWVRLLLNGQIDEAAKVAPRIAEEGFAIYLTQSLEEAKKYVRDRYADEPSKRFGLLASSKAKNLPAAGVNNTYGFTKNLREGPWYNDAPDSLNSCCQLREVATEFACQGLELDMPIVCWGSDLRFFGGVWVTPRVTARNTAKDPRGLRINSYRVLLSRGRDGLVIFVPQEDSMTETVDALRAAGARPITTAS